MIRATLLAALTLGSCVATTPPGNAPQPVTPPAAPKTPGKVPIPSHGLLIGAQTGPGVPSPFSNVAPGISPIYVKFGSKFPTLTGPGYPMIDLDCPATLASVTDGSSDAWIASFASSIKAYGKPVFVRFCWEMNLPAKATANGGTPADYVATWNYLFARLPPWVSRIWAPSGGGADSLPYFPGVANVDVIAADRFDRDLTAKPGGFARVVAVACATYGKMGVPMGITATGAYAVNQVSFFTDMASVGTLCPAIKLIRIFDSPGKGESFVDGPEAVAKFQAFVAANVPSS